MRVIDAPSTWVTADGRAMGSRWRAVLGGAPDGLADWVGHELARLESAWTRFDPTSELRRAQDAAGGRWVDISTTLATVLDRALRLAHHTGGVFDPTVGGCLVALGYDRSFRLVERDGAGPVASQPAVGYDGIELDLGRPALRLRPGTVLDLGGVGKGLAADLLVDGALDRGATSACVGVGGDVRLGGIAPVGGWSIPLADPTGGPGQTITLTSGAVVTSTTAVRRWRRGGRALHHLVEPTTGEPAASGILAVIATADRAWWAEGIAKAALILGPGGGGRLMRRSGVDGWLVGDDGSWSRVGPT